MKYQITKKECQKRIDELNNVCDRCGRKIIPIRTVDNAGNPTYWSGCFHSQNDKNDWGNFTEGVKKEIFELAEKLVCAGEWHYSHLNKNEYASTPEKRLYWFQEEVSGMCGLLNKIEYLKSNKPQKTKKEFLEDKYF